MTKKHILFPIIILAIGAVCFGRLERWPVTQKPAIALTQAEAIGDTAIARHHKGFFCIGARFAMLGDKEQEWELSYTNPTGSRKWVVIDGDGNAKVHESMRDL